MYEKDLFNAQELEAINLFEFTNALLLLSNYRGKRITHNQIEYGSNPDVLLVYGEDSVLGLLYFSVKNEFAKFKANCWDGGYLDDDLKAWIHVHSTRKDLVN